MRRVTFINQSKATVIGEKIAVADTFLTRFVGLMGKRSLEAGAGLWIVPSSGVHTFWMRMSIDVVALDRNLRVVSIGRDVRPWRISCVGWRIHSVLELPSGMSLSGRIELGDQLTYGGELPSGELWGKS